MLYSDEPRRYRPKGKRWAHIIADSLLELKKFAKEWGLKRFDSKPWPHYDVTDMELMRLSYVKVLNRKEFFKKLVEINNGRRKKKRSSAAR